MSDRIRRWTMPELPPALAEALRPRVERLGYLGEFFQCAANVPDALLAFDVFTAALKRAVPEQATGLSRRRRSAAGSTPAASTP